MYTAVLLTTGKRESASSARLRHRIAGWLRIWEIYPLLLFAAALRLYQLPWTEFDADQAALVSLPRMALAHGLIPGTGAFASIGLANPPGYVYLFLPIAALTASPLIDAIFTALLNVLAVLLTYLFVRRYAGRLAATCSALLFAAAYQSVLYSRFLWQPNLLPFFTLLFVIALFRGVVERRSGWLAAALPLWSFLLQLHLLTLYLAVPLLLALVLAYQTVRWRDVALGVALSFVLFLAYCIWEVGVHFADLAILLAAWRQPAHLDGQALRFYLELVATPQLALPHSALAVLNPLLPWEHRGLVVLLLGGLLLALLGLFCRRVHIIDDVRFPEQTLLHASARRWWWKSWNALACSPQRAGLLLLLVWQIAPVLLLTHHAVDLQFHYLLFLLPGPFILIGLLVGQLAMLSTRLTFPGDILARLAGPALAAVLILVQICSTGAWVLDSSGGRVPHGVRFNTLQDLQAALNEADSLARARHVHHVYIDADQYTYDAFTYLAGAMQTPRTIFNGSHCLLLPSPAQGPALLLLGPADTLDEALLTHVTSAVLLAQPSRLGGMPFHLYLVPPLVAAAGGAVFAGTLRAERGHLASFAWNDPAQPGLSPLHLLTTLWTSMRAWPAVDGTGYTYHFVARPVAGAGSSSQECGFTALAPGEEFLVPFVLSTSALAVSGSFSRRFPYEQSYGPFHLLSVRQQVSVPQVFHSTAGGNSILLSG
jgi:hypothetical protein